MKYARIWITDEIPVRCLTVQGRSAIDPDCLVAYVEGSDKPLWIIDDGSPQTKRAAVCGLEGNVYARPVMETEVARSRALLRVGRHNGWPNRPDTR